MNAKMRRIIKICIPIVVALCIIIAGVIFIANYEPYNKASIAKNPKAQLIKSYEKTLAVLEEGMAFQIPDAFFRSFTDGSIEAVLKTEEDATVSGTMYLRDNSFALTGAVTQGKNDPVKYGVYVNDENIAVDLPAVLEDTIYGIQPMKLKEDLKDSALLDVLQLNYDDVAEILDAIMAMKPAEEADKNGKDWATMLEMKLRLKTLLDSCAVSVADGSLATDLGSIKVFRVSYAMTPAQMCEGLDILVNWVITTDAYKAATEDMEGFTEELKANLEELKKEIVASNATAILYFYLHGKTQIITMAELRVDWFVEKEPATFLATINLGADPVQSMRYTVELSVDLPDEYKETVSLTYERSHAHNLPGRKLVVSYNEEEYTLMEIQINSVTNAFDLSLFDNALSVSGVCKNENGKVYATVNLEDIGDLSLTFTGEAQAPAMPEYTNICTLSEMELLRLFIEYLPIRYADIIVEAPDGETEDYYLSHKYCSLGELLEDLNMATLDDQGRIVTMHDYDAPAEVEVYTWEVYLNGELVEGSLYELVMDYKAEITIRDVTDYPEEDA